MINKEQIRQIQAYVGIHAVDAGALGARDAKGEDSSSLRDVAQHSWQAIVSYLDEITENGEDYHLSHKENEQIIDFAQRYAAECMEVENLRQKKAAGPYTQVDQEFSKELDAKIQSALDKRDHIYDTLDQYLNTLLIGAENLQEEDDRGEEE